MQLFTDTIALRDGFVPLAEGTTTARILHVRTRLDHVDMVYRALSAIDRKDEVAALTVPHSGDQDTEEELFRGFVDGLVDRLESGRSTLEDDDNPRHEMERILALQWTPRPNAAEGTKRYLENLEAELGWIAPRIVFVVTLEDATPPSVRECFAACCEQFVGGSTRLVVVDACTEDVFGNVKLGNGMLTRVGFNLGPAAIEKAVSETLTAGGLARAEAFTLHLMLAGFASAKGERERAQEQVEAALKLAKTEAERATARLTEGYSRYRARQLEQAEAAFHAGLLAVEDSSPTGAALTASLLYGLASVGLVAKRFDEAAPLYEEAAHLYDLLGHVIMAGAALSWCGETHHRAGNNDLAEATWDRALAGLDRAGDSLDEASGALRAELLLRKARLANHRGQRDQAKALHDRACNATHEPYLPNDP